MGLLIVSAWVSKRMHLFVEEEARRTDAPDRSSRVLTAPSTAQKLELVLHDCCARHT